MAVDMVVLDPFSVNGWIPKQTFATDITTTRSGGEQRVQRWLRPKRSYEIPFDVMERNQFTSLRDFHSLRGGSARSFLIWDVSRFYAESQALGAGNGSNRFFQLATTISDGGNSLTETVQHPVPTGTSIPYNLQGLNPGVPTASFTVEVNGVAKTEGSDYSVSPTTGVIAFTIPPLSGQAVTASFWFYTSVRFSSDEYQMTLDSLYAKAQLELIEVFGE